MNDSTRRNSSIEIEDFTGLQQEPPQTPDRVAKLANAIWEMASPVEIMNPSTHEHDFIGLELRQYQTALLMPVRGAEGDISNLFRVYPDGGVWLLGAGKVDLGGSK
ncbi:MAG: hypothetical protein KDI17_07125 [Halioglobus sp.]|nr:hypothetical protein [Halioglobus sp.]